MAYQNKEVELIDLIKLYEPIIKSVIKKYLEYAAKVGLDYDDLFQEASMAVLQAQETYKDNKNMKLETWIYNNINWRIQRVLEGNKKYENTVSINSTVGSDEEDTTELIDLIADDLDLQEEVQSKIIVDYYEKECKRILPEDKFQVCYLRWFENYPYKAIEKVTEKNNISGILLQSQSLLLAKSRLFNEEYRKLVGISEYNTERLALI